MPVVVDEQLQRSDIQYVEEQYVDMNDTSTRRKIPSIVLAFCRMGLQRKLPSSSLRKERAFIRVVETRLQHSNMPHAKRMRVSFFFLVS
jgi:hypothetical protein